MISLYGLLPYWQLDYIMRYPVNLIKSTYVVFYAIMASLS